MERDKRIEILENGSESELTLIQNYLLDQILKKMPTETEAIQRCVESSEKIKELEAEIIRLKILVNSLQTDLNIERGSKRYNTANGTGTSWSDYTVTCSNTSVSCSPSTTTTYTSKTII